MNYARPRARADRRVVLQALLPIVKAFGASYVINLLPRLPLVLRIILTSRCTSRQRLERIKVILLAGFGAHRLPAAFALIAAGYGIGAHALTTLLVWLTAKRYQAHVLFDRVRPVVVFATSCIAFKLLNDDQQWTRKRAASRAAKVKQEGYSELPNQHESQQMVGKTIDLTAFLACRALDAASIAVWTGMTRLLRPSFNKATGLLKMTADPLVFSTSAAVIMWSWFYSPERLPKQYNDWISEMAEIDPSLIEALRLCRQGRFVYGHDTGKGQLLVPLCRRLKLPERWADPTRTIPIPCELYHCGAGKSCEVHAAQKFWTTYLKAIKLYLPLQALSVLKHQSLDVLQLQHLLEDAARSSAFLASFVTIFYYSVCLARTRLGPALFDRRTVTPQMWDSGLCVLAGALACGWSILLEKQSRRQEIAFFVAPRAVATVLPRVYNQQSQWKECLAFSSSVTIILSALPHGNVRGILGQLLSRVLE